MRLVFILLLAFFLLGSLQLAHADSWLPPAPMSFFSAGENYQLYIEPGTTEVRAEEIHPEDAAAGEKPHGASPCLATMKKKNEDGSFSELWTRALENPVLPVDALVAGDGSFFVTFDDYGSIGTSDNTVVIYDGEGKMIRKYALTQLLSEEEYAAVPRTVSSLMWYEGAHELSADGKTLILHTAREIRIDLASGAIQK